MNNYLTSEQIQQLEPNTCLVRTKYGVDTDIGVVTQDTEPYIRWQMLLTHGMTPGRTYPGGKWDAAIDWYSRNCICEGVSIRKASDMEVAMFVLSGLMD